MTATYFILNGPFAGEQIPYTNAPDIKHQHGPGRWVSYEPAPASCCEALGLCVMLLGSKVTAMPGGKVVLAHPRWVPTVLEPCTGDISEIESAAPGVDLDAVADQIRGKIVN